MINGTAVEKLLDAMEKLQDVYRDMLNAAELAAPKVKIAHDYKLWIDDVRPAPAGWITFTTVNGALDFIHQAILDGDVISMISLDHDAGAYRKCGGDYINLLNSIEYEINVKKDFGGSRMEDFINNTTFHIHSQNPVGRQNMERIINRNGWKYYQGEIK